jgi:hypothetical protein
MTEIERLRAALETADEVLGIIQSAAVKKTPHGIDLNWTRAIIASALAAQTCRNNQS